MLTGPGGVLETVIRNHSRPYAPLVAVNTGAIRFDIFQGNFTVNDELITMPFNNAFVYIPDVPRSAAAQFLTALNAGRRFPGVASSAQFWVDSNKCNNDLAGGAARVRRGLMDQSVPIKDDDYHRGLDVDKIYLSSLRRQASLQTHFASIGKKPRSMIKPQSYGYVTHDQCPGVGDDTPHIALSVHDPPEYIATALPPDAPAVDIVFYRYVHTNFRQLM